MMEFLTCVKCEVQLQPKKIAGAVETRTVDGPYGLHGSDLKHCPSCGMEVAVSAREPMVEHYNTRFATVCAKFEQEKKLFCRSWLNVKEKEAANANH